MTAFFLLFPFRVEAFEIVVGKSINNKVVLSEPDKVWTYLGKFYEINRKDEFETWDQFYRRMGVIEQEIAKHMKQTTGDERVVFAVPVQSAISYDADSQVMTVGGQNGLLKAKNFRVDPTEGFMVHNYDLEELKGGVVVSFLPVPKKTSVANFGADYGISLLVHPDKKVSVFPRENYQLTMKYKPDIAKKIKEGCQLLLVCRVVAPFLMQEVRTVGTSEKNITSASDVISVMIEESYFFEKRSGVVLGALYKSQGPIPPAGWYSFLRELTKRGS